VKHVLRYLQGTIGYHLRYTSSIDMRSQGYTEYDWAGSTVDRKRTFGCFFTLGFSMVSWCSKKQNSMDLSTVEAEYIALSVEVCEVVWLQNLLASLFVYVMDSIVIHCDNQICVKLSKNLGFYDKSKDIEIKYHYIQYMV
jgi:hypothetical protein